MTVRFIEMFTTRGESDVTSGLPNGLGVALRAGVLRAPLSLGLPAGRPLRALRIPNAGLSRRLPPAHRVTEGFCHA